MRFTCAVGVIAPAFVDARRSTRVLKYCHELAKIGSASKVRSLCEALPAYARASIVQGDSEARSAEHQKTRLNIKVPSVATRTSSLSGGNQQKVVLARWLSMSPKVIIFDEPTRGIDVGAKGEIYELMRSLADSGVAILMISSDMEEVIGVSDRIAVMHEGRVIGFLARCEFSEDRVLQLAVGKSPQAAPAMKLAIGG